MQIISIHVPKAGGTSMLDLWRRTFGPQRVLADYQDPPGDPAARHLLDPDGWQQARPRTLDPGVRVVHGHFRPHKYDQIEDVFRLTLLRHPLQNMLSIYFYWKTIPPQPSALHRYFLEQRLDLLGLARLPLLRHLYSQTYFGGWDMGRLDFIGGHEDRPATLRRLERALGLKLDTDTRLNVTPPAPFEEERGRLLDDQQLMRRLQDLLMDDIRFYETHVHQPVRS